MWELALQDQHFLKETIRILDPPLIQHLVLSTLSAHFLPPLYMTNAQHRPPCLTTVVSILSDYSHHFSQYYGHLNLFHTRVGTVSTSARFFSQLDNNFELIGGHLTLHLDETLIVNTFERVLSQLETIPQSPNAVLSQLEAITQSSNAKFGFFAATSVYFVERLLNIIKAKHQPQDHSNQANITHTDDEPFSVHTQPPVSKCL